MTCHIRFCGAAGTVTGSCYLITLDNGYKILLEAGLYQGREEEFLALNNPWLFDPAEIDAVILSHSHIDHSGRIPKLVSDGFQGPIICTEATKALCGVMLLDSARIQERDAEWENKRLRKAGQPAAARALYTVENAEKSLGHFTGIAYEQWHPLCEGVSVILKDSGHIFGSASVTLRVVRAGGEPLLIGFTGDIGRPNRPILKDPQPLSQVDYLICESTYGGVRHRDVTSDQHDLLAIIRDTCVERRGKVLIPAFSIGRTQEIVYMLDQLETAGELPKIPVFVDSPLAVNATEVFRHHPECFDSQVLAYMRQDPNPFGFNDLHYIRKVEHSKALNRMEGPAIIISASGMMNAGRIRHHLFNHMGDAQNTILIVGHCAPHTLGARLRRGDRRVRLFGAERDVQAQVLVRDSYSAHGDEQEMLDYLDGQDRQRLQSIFLVHGDPGRQAAFQSALKARGFGGVHIPQLNEEVPLSP